MGAVLWLILTFALAGIVTFTTFRMLPVGCVFERTLLQQSRINANQDGYGYIVHIQGLYNPLSFCIMTDRACG